MFDNYLEQHPDKLESVNNTPDVVRFILNMLEFFGIELFFDPSKAEPERKDGEDDLFVYCQVSENCHRLFLR